MKKIFLINSLLFAFCLLNYSQNIEEMYFHKNSMYMGIKKITYTYNSKWKTVYFYNKQGLLERQINCFKNSKRADYHFEHTLTDTTFTIKEREDKEHEESYRICRYLYDKNGNCIKMEVFSSNKLDIPFVVSESFIYNDDNLLLEYKHNASINWKYKYFYNNKKQKIKKIEFDDDFEENAITTVFEYNNKGIIIKEDMLYEGYNLYADGKYIFPYNQSKPMRIVYLYEDIDKHGNWKKSYYLTEKGKVFRSKRKIGYW